MNRRALLLSLTAALALSAAVAFGRGGFDPASPAEGYRAWSDGFFAGAALVGGLGLIAFAASDGLFDALRFSAGRLINVLRKPEKRALYPKTFYDYRQLRRGRGAGGGALALAGGVCLVLAALFLVLYLRYEGAGMALPMGE